jgi:hypothetical protein
MRFDSADPAIEGCGGKPRRDGTAASGSSGGQWPIANRSPLSHGIFK